MISHPLRVADGTAYFFFLVAFFAAFFLAAIDLIPPSRFGVTGGWLPPSAHGKK